MENELVVKAVLPVAQASGFQLTDPFPAWPRRGLPLLPGHQHLIRIGEGLHKPVAPLHVYQTSAAGSSDKSLFLPAMLLHT